MTTFKLFQMVRTPNERSSHRFIPYIENEFKTVEECEPYKKAAVEAGADWVFCLPKGASRTSLTFEHPCLSRCDLNLLEDTVYYPGDKILCPDWVKEKAEVMCYDPFKRGRES